MRNLTTWIGAVTASAAFAPSAWAVYTGISAHLHTTVPIGGQSYDVYRLYANFDDPGDRLVAVFGSPMLGPMTLQTRNSNDTALGSAFYNSPLDRITAPSAAVIGLDPNEQWDTFVTIGVSVTDQSPYGDMTYLTPGFTGISGTSTTYTNGGWYTVPTFDHDTNPSTPDIPPPQTLAGWTGDGDSALRVLIMQLTVRAGENIRGTINIDLFPPMGQGGGFPVIHQPFQTFNTYVAPGPSVLALLAVACVRGQRRRR